MSEDRSEGWDSVAEHFMSVRSDIGASLVRSWALEHVPRSGAILDIGCGSGIPITQALVQSGFEVFGIDASANLIAAFRRNLPGVPNACEPVQDSAFFHRKFDAAVMIGLSFLLSERDQRQVIHRVAESLNPHARLLFTAPRQRCEWPDALTGSPSRSLGDKEYGQILEARGFGLVGTHVDDGGNHYFDAIRVVVEPR